MNRVRSGMSRNPQREAFRKLPLCIALAGCLYGTTALAQEAQQVPPAGTSDETEQQADQPAPADVTNLEKVTVTGSLLRRVEYDSTSPIQVITADTSVAVGQVDTAQFLQKSSVAAGSTQINHQFSGFVVEGGTGVQTVSLRGLGPQRTLVLLNGNRPGPAGTRGQVGAFDLNVIPTSVLQRVEILKDGASSIYGSDAVAGVVNLITRKRVDKPEITLATALPSESGGEVFDITGVTGWNFNTGSIVLAAQYFLHKEMNLGDRDFFNCAEDLVHDQDGNRIDREDRSIIAGTELGGCTSGNLYANTVIDALTGKRYIPSPDGVTIGLIPGYRPRTNGTYANGGQAYFQDVLNFDFMANSNIINRQERFNLYGSSDFSLGDVNWTTEWLYNRRETQSRQFRQFFPVVGGATSPIAAYRYANDPTYVAPVPSGIAQPIMPFRSDQDIKVEYFYLNTGLDGLLPFADWSWRANASYSRSKGDYSSLGIQASRSGDVTYSDDAPSVDYFDPGFLSGGRMDELVDAIGVWHTGSTIYDQFVLNGVVTGDLFQLPAGAVGAAIGAEYRDFSIDDQPSELSRNADLWGQTSAQVTKGDDQVKEVFAEIEVPLLKGKPMFESLVFNASARVFDYNSVDGSDNVWKVGLGWQVNPTVKLRATRGTSYRAPGLYELYLGNQSGFVSQLSIDPCINWSESTNDFVRANCATAGIPDNYNGAPASATVFTGGGAGSLAPETSTAFTTGLILTPTWAPISLALDYFEFKVQDEIASLGANSILGGCYGSPVFPNHFCDLFLRNPNNHPTDPNKIEEVHAVYININEQKVRGYDLLARFDKDFSFGKLEVEGQFTYVIEDFEQLFDTSEASGFATDDHNGEIGRPRVVGNVRTALHRNDWTYTWFMDYTGPTKNLNLDGEFTYFGFPNAIRDIHAEKRLYHTFSVRYDHSDWSVLVGIRNILDADPPTVSTGVATRYGNVPAFATQYDYYGRTLFARFNYKF